MEKLAFVNSKLIIYAKNRSNNRQVSLIIKGIYDTNISFEAWIDLETWEISSVYPIK